MHILFDVGGTHMRLATSIDGKSLGNEQSFSTPHDFAESLKIFRDYIKVHSSEASPLLSIVGGLPGVLNVDKTELVRAPNLEGWVGEPIEAEIAKLANVRVWLHNDAALAALGEATNGAGRHYAYVAYLTISTGIGGARVSHKRLDHSHQGFEPGQQIMNLEDHKDLQMLVSGKALEDKYGKKPSEIDSSANWDEFARILAVGLNNLIVFWSPDVVVLGGGVVLNSPLSIPLTAEYTKQFLKALPKCPPIVRAQLGDQSGLYGALAYAEHKNGN